MTDSPKRLVLLSGPLAVGKTTLRERLVSEHGFEYVRSSRFLMEMARRENLLIDRRSLQELGDRLDRETDYRWIVDDVAKPSMDALPSQDRWLVDAVRKARQVEHFRRMAPATVRHVHLTAPEVVLRDRYEKRRLEGNDKDSAPYDEAIAHDNERAARSLIEVADLVLDMSEMTVGEAIDLIVSH
ncbi:AAA family ATPase [Paraburkholderia aspalathi]|uniref:Adenylosuccinate synthase n=1 Tax=Paraburkholderia aspalathi TaxID=1324617 RepID=A0A1I7CDR4_9BURK|nr:AAA family ATPase [Paraburkholderia aspalathi]SFT97560.1 adenylosuccinate synthase [Paraburkholderia aspalathi]